MATAAQVDRVLRSLIRRFGDADPGAKPNVAAERTIVCRITDLGVYYRGEYRDGRIERFARVKNGQRGDITIGVSSDDLIALTEGRLSLTRALFTGRLDVNAGARDMILLRQLL